jgi:hypothetical protein
MTRRWRPPLRNPLSTRCFVCSFAGRGCPQRRPCAAPSPPRNRGAVQPRGGGGAGQRGRRVHLPGPAWLPHGAGVGCGDPCRRGVPGLPAPHRAAAGAVLRARRAHLPAAVPGRSRWPGGGPRLGVVRARRSRPRHGAVAHQRHPLRLAPVLQPLPGRAGALGRAGRAGDIVPAAGRLPVYRNGSRWRRCAACWISPVRLRVESDGALHFLSR